MMSLVLQSKGFEVTLAASVTEALKLIMTESFDVLITDLHMPNPSDGFAVITAMRHTQPDALTLLVSGYPDVKSAMDGILLQADDIIIKPFDAGTLAELVNQKLLTRLPAVRLPKARVATILQQCSSDIIHDWLLRVKNNKDLNRVSLTDEQRTGYLPKLIDDLVVRLRDPHVPGDESDSVCSAAATAHGKMRQVQGYTPAMLVHDYSGGGAPAAASAPAPVEAKRTAGLKSVRTYSVRSIVPAERIAVAVDSKLAYQSPLQTPPPIVPKRAPGMTLPHNARCGCGCLIDPLRRL